MAKAVFTERLLKRELIQLFDRQVFLTVRANRHLGIDFDVLTTNRKSLSPRFDVRNDQLPTREAKNLSHGIPPRLSALATERTEACRPGGTKCRCKARVR